MYDYFSNLGPINLKFTRKQLTSPCRIFSAPVFHLPQRRKVQRHGRSQHAKIRLRQARFGAPLYSLPCCRPSPLARSRYRVVGLSSPPSLGPASSRSALLAASSTCIGHWPQTMQTGLPLRGGYVLPRLLIFAIEAGNQIWICTSISAAKQVCFLWSPEGGIKSDRKKSPAVVKNGFALRPVIAHRTRQEQVSMLIERHCEGRPAAPCRICCQFQE
jgi:hypothetical protein